MGSIDREQRFRKIPPRKNSSILQTYDWVPQQQANYTKDPERSEAYPLNPFDLPHEPAILPENADQ